MPREATCAVRISAASAASVWLRRDGCRFVHADTHQPAHGGDREGGLILAHGPEPFDGIVFVSRANQAAAFERIPLSSLSWRFSCRSWVSSSRSAVVSPLPRRPASHSAWPTQFLIDCAVGSNSCARSSGERPARTSSTIWRRNSGG